MEQFNKPKLVFFQNQSEYTPKYICLHLEQHVKCLSEFFDVTVIHQDCDYQEICDRYQPDLALFESSVYPGKHLIKNTSCYSEIPKIGFIHADAYCVSREAIISDMDRWGIETFFSLAVAMGEYIPEISDNLFIWPNFVDGNLYRDYHESKIIPVLFTGSQATHYPWRNRISRIIAQHYPFMMCPHFGWYGKQTSRMVHGEQYARMLNASWFVPACGTIAKEVVRKHFEVPASKSCLIAERTRALEAAGFVDMQNCVFADENDVLDKLDDLFQNPDELEKVINAGYQLVHSRHTLKQRDQIFQWFSLYKNLKPNQKIIQTSPFEPLIVVDKSLGIKNTHIIGPGLDRELLREGDRKLWSGKYNEAETLYLRCINYQASMPEPKLRLALCNLYKGNVNTAISWIGEPIKETLETYKAVDPDPVEWAYFIICLLCQGKLDTALDAAQKYPSLKHVELDRSCWIINVLKNGNTDNKPIKDEELKYRYSVHQMPNWSVDEWVNNLFKMLEANQQFEVAKRLSNLLYNKGEDLNNNNIEIKTKSNKLKVEISSFIKKFKEGQKTNWPKSKLRKLVFKPTKQIVSKTLNSLEDKFGYFLPYRFSKMREDELFYVVQKLTKEEDIKTALLIGASIGRGTTEAFLAGSLQNPNKPDIFCINLETPDFHKLQKRYTKNFAVKFYGVKSVLSENNGYNAVEICLNKIYLDNQIHFFDLLLIDSFELNIDINSKKIGQPSFILLDDINTLQNHMNCRRLLEDKNYTLLAQNPALRNGYAIFRKSFEKESE